MPSRPFPPTSPTKTKVLFLALTISACVVIFCSFLYFLYHLWHSLVHRAKTIPFDASAPLKLQRFSYKDLKQATNGFDTANVIGKGGSGTVFRGILKDGKLIAIKRLDTLSLQSEREFQNELQILGGLRSPFLVTLLGYCVEKNKRVLVYEYMPNRSLQESLFGEGSNLTAETPAIGTPVESVSEVDFALALQASSSSKNTLERDDWNGKFFPYDDELSSIDYSKELTVNASSLVDDEKANGKQWGKDWWWKQDGSGELCSKDYVMEWIGSQICPSNPDWDDGKNNVHEKVELENSSPKDKDHDAIAPQPQVFGIGYTADNGVEKKVSRGKKNHKKKHRKMQEWWREEHLAELSKKTNKLKSLHTKWKKGLKVPHFDLGRRFYLCRRKKFGEEGEDECDQNGEFSFRRGWRKKSTLSIGSDMWSGDLFSRELSSTTSMRGTLCYVAPEYGGCGFLMEKADIYSFGVLILVIVSGRRPLHVLASPMKLEKANLISWCRHLAQAGNILELVDERLKEDYNKDQASLCINLALTCLQKIPELRPDIGDIVKILKGEMDLPPLPFEFSPSPPSKLYSKSRRKQKGTPE
uniref:non-specific serine/threonine protein kinase n=1 Tax=Cajanus cajan TaxID=3821 RepID=A0A151S6K2_CAJCA|nr:putative LRR receptor-like serine/threonine-protein kinase At1g53420 family [Cajanus cajan]